MSTEQTEQGQQWRAQKTLVVDWDYWQVCEGNRLVADFITTEAEANQIVSDHNELNQLREYKSALERIRDGYHSGLHTHKDAYAEAAHALSPEPGPQEGDAL